MVTARGAMEEVVGVIEEVVGVMEQEAEGMEVQTIVEVGAVVLATIRDFKIPGRLTSRTVILRAEDWAETVVLGGKLSTLRSGLLERRTAANLKFLALFLNYGIF